MNEQNQSIVIEDLAARNAVEIKSESNSKAKNAGILPSSAASAANGRLADLEPQGDIVGGLKGTPQTCINNTKSNGCSG